MLWCLASLHVVVQIEVHMPLSTTRPHRSCPIPASGRSRSGSRCSRRRPWVPVQTPLAAKSKQCLKCLREEGQEKRKQNMPAPQAMPDYVLHPAPTSPQPAAALEHVCHERAASPIFNSDGTLTRMDALHPIISSPQYRVAWC